jgi:IQ calmodulin-binding motif
VILRYETVRLQSFFRGKKVHTDFIVTLGSIIVVQSRCRQYLASKRAMSLRAIKAIRCSQSEGLRETGAAKRIQFFWRVVLECRREKKAALVIERFFAKVKEEVDREIRKAARRKQSKRRRSHKKHSSNSDCESSVDQEWIDSLDELTFSKSRSTDSTSVLSRHSSTKRGTSVLSSAESLGHKSGVRHRASSPTLNLVMRHERDSKSKSVPQVVAKAAAPREDPQDLRKPRRFRLSLDASEVAVDTSEKYMKMYGVRSAPLRGSKERHFFKDGDVIDYGAGATPKSTISGPASTRSDASTSVGWRRLLVESNSSLTLGDVGRSPQVGRSIEQSSSPRHGKILVMKPYPEHHPSHSDETPDDADGVEFLGDDFGMI